MVNAKIGFAILLRFSWYNVPCTKRPVLNGRFVVFVKAVIYLI